MRKYIRRVMNPAWYHGHHRKPPFFEGWYFKMIDQQEQQRWAVIPGIFINRDPSKTHAFIQVLDGTNGRTTYHTYPADTFVAAHDEFDVRVGSSHFRQDCISLDIDDEQGTFQGALYFENLQPWPVTLLSPGIMGPFGWLPFMECNHGVLSLDHSVRGKLEINGQQVDFTGGRGYIEKDWGRAFPDGYIWLQSNHFDEPGVSLTGSIATIPNFGISWVGFILGLWLDGELYRFTTYNRSVSHRLAVQDDTVEWTLYNRRHELQMTVTRAEGGLLKGPERADMHKRVDETMRAAVDLELFRLDGLRKQRIYRGHGRNTALEVIGNLRPLLKP